MKRFTSILLAAVLAAVLLAGCGAAPSSQPASKPASQPVSQSEPAPAAPEYERATVRVAYMPNKLTQFQGGPAEIAAMASGDIDISQIGHGAHALCIEGQAKIFALDLLGVSDEVLANKERGINSVADLKGKTVASTAGTSAEIVLNLVLSTAGLTQDDVKVVEMDANGC